MFILRNYNKFLVGTRESYRWDDFFIHRFDTDFNKLVKFDSRKDCEAFIKQHPEIERGFYAWPMEATKEDWS